MVKTLMFDIGANLGLWTAANYKEGVRVICVEPNIEVHDELGKLLRGKDAVLIKKAVSDKSDKTIDFYLASTHWASTASIEFKEKCTVMSWKTIQAQTVTIEDLIKQYGEPDYIKVDVERYEYVALQGLKHKSGLIAFEWDNENSDNTSKCVDYLHELGYDQFFVYETDTYTFLPEIWFNYTDIRSQLVDILDRNLGYKWGMIYAK